MRMFGRKRLESQRGRHALVDGIPFVVPVDCKNMSALMAAFPIDIERAREFFPGNEVHPLRVWNHGLLIVTVVDYRETVIGKYIEFSVAIACTHGPRPAPRLVPLLFRDRFDVGQFVVDLPVSTEISVKGGKGIWGMPKHQANLDFRTTDRVVSSQYDLDGDLCVKIEVDRPSFSSLPIRVGGANFCTFRGLLMKSYVYFTGKAGVTLGKRGAARLTLGNHPRVEPLKRLLIAPDPIFTAYIPEAHGMLDDYFESWFVSCPDPIAVRPEGFESVINLGLGEQWLPAPKAPAGAPRPAVRVYPQVLS
jgi:Acetoacetate decarboxylase (ADC)